MSAGVGFSRCLPRWFSRGGFSPPAGHAPSSTCRPAPNTSEDKTSVRSPLAPPPPPPPEWCETPRRCRGGGRLVSRPVGKPGTARSVALRFAARTLCVPQRSGPAAHSHCKNFDGPGDFRTWLALAGWSQWTCVRAVACFLLVSGVCGCVCGGALPEPGVPIQSVPPARAEIPVGAHLLNCV